MHCAGWAARSARSQLSCSDPRSQPASRQLEFSATRCQPPTSRLYQPLPGVPAPRIRQISAWTPPDYLALALSRLRATQQTESITFTAQCPSCGSDCEWTEEREDTRLVVSVTCSCVVRPR